MKEETEKVKETCFSSEPLEGTRPARSLPLAQLSLPQELEDSKFVLF